MKKVRGLALAALLCTGFAQAQLKPSGPGTPPLPQSPNEAQQNEAQAFKELAARMAAERWLAVIDAGEYGKAWDQSAKVFRERVTREQWVEGIPKTCTTPLRRGASSASPAWRASSVCLRPTARA